MSVFSVSASALSLTITALVVTIVATISLSVTFAATSEAIREFALSNVDTIAKTITADIEYLVNRTSVHANTIVNTSRTAKREGNLRDSALQLRRLLDSTTLSTMRAGLGTTAAGYIAADLTCAATRFWTVPGVFAEEWYVNKSTCATVADCAYSRAVNATTMTAFPVADPINDFSDYNSATEANLRFLFSTFQISTLGSRTPIWTGPAVWSQNADNSRPFHASTLITPVPTPSGVGVAGFAVNSISVASLSAFLQLRTGLLPEGSASALFVIDHVSFIVAASTPQTFLNVSTVAATEAVIPIGCDTMVTAWGFPVHEGSLKTVVCRSAARNYPFPPLQELVLSQGFDPAEARFSRIELASESWYVAAAPVKARAINLHFTALVFEPESALMGSFITGRTKAIAASVGFLAASMLVAAFVLHLLLLPLRTVATQLRDTSYFSAAPDAAGRHGVCLQVSELDPLLFAHAAMRSELTRIRAFIPKEAMEAFTDGPAKPNVETETQRTSTYAPRRCESASEVAAIEAAMSRGSTRSSIRPPKLRREQSNTGAGSQSAKSVRFAFDDSVATVSYRLKPKLVTIVSCHAHGLRHSASHHAMATRTGQLVAQVARIVGDFGGRILSFHGFTFLLQFTSEGDRAGVVLRNALLASFAVFELTTDVSPQAVERQEMLYWTAGIDTGFVLTGPAGCEGATSVQCVGRIVSAAADLEGIARMLRRRTILVPTAVTATIKDRFTCRDVHVADSHISEVLPPSPSGYGGGNGDEPVVSWQIQALRLSTLPAVARHLQSYGVDMAVQLPAVLAPLASIADKESTASLGLFWQASCQSVRRARSAPQHAASTTAAAAEWTTM